MRRIRGAMRPKMAIFKEENDVCRGPKILDGDDATYHDVIMMSSCHDVAKFFQMHFRCSPSVNK